MTFTLCTLSEHIAVQVMKVANEAFKSLSSAAAAVSRPCLVLDIQTPKDK